MSDQRHGVIAYNHGHQSHHADRCAVALLAPSAGGNGVAVMRSFTATCWQYRTGFGRHRIPGSAV